MLEWNSIRDSLYFQISRYSNVSYICNGQLDPTKMAIVYIYYLQLENPGWKMHPEATTIQTNTSSAMAVGAKITRTNHAHRAATVIILLDALLVVVALFLVIKIVQRWVPRIMHTICDWLCLRHIQPRAPYDFYHPFDFLPVRPSEAPVGILRRRCSRGHIRLRAPCGLKRL